MRIEIIPGFVLVLALGACDNFDSRVANRAATGATIGAVASAVVGGKPLRGAAVGGAVGILTSQNRLVWE